jgi:hypothetical protein
MTKILRCDCHHEYQDKIYGKGMRLHTPKEEPEKNGYRCTVCGKINR